MMGSISTGELLILLSCCDVVVCTDGRESGVLFEISESEFPYMFPDLGACLDVVPAWYVVLPPTYMCEAAETPLRALVVGREYVRGFVCFLPNHLVCLIIFLTESRQLLRMVYVSR